MFGDWGLGIGDWAQSPIPNPQSPIILYKIIRIILHKYNLLQFKIKKFDKIINYYNYYGSLYLSNLHATLYRTYS